MTKSPGHFTRVIVGQAEMTSDLFSNSWTLVSGGQVLAQAVRRPRHRITGVELADGTRWVLQPDGWGVVRCIEEDVPIAKIIRQSALNRRWEASGVGYSYTLASDGMVPRRWVLQIGDEPCAWLRGASLTYNKVHIEAPISIPLSAAVLSWHVVARPWEAAAFAPDAIRPEQTATRSATPAPEAPTSGGA